ncbi:MAG TPA: DUF3105 domain-containing protein [Roseiflexaceae bacterium]|nr:DUF3105 domain-containing protein [Roseiflexaceae bacterium]HMP42281.1 DUF3105 domain-containing protein [Roseiflexaceae bacterium]
MTQAPRNRSRGSRGRAPATRRNNNRGFLIAGGIVAVVVILVVARMLVSAPQNIDGIQRFSNMTAGHTDQPVVYPQTPPVGGPHSPAWQNCGIYDQPIASENAVHSLEHGAVWITYDPALPAADIETLRSKVRGRSYLLLSPFPGLPGPVFASAWGVQLRADGVDDPRIDTFISEYRQGPQTPEPGAVCTNGVGTPSER